jgi:hypothetical protein
MASTSHRAFSVAAMQSIVATPSSTAAPAGQAPPNREKGEFAVTIGGTSYIFVLNVKAMIAGEALATETFKAETTWDQLMDRMARGSAQAFVIFIWCMLQDRQPGFSLEQVYTLLDEGGGPAGLRALVMKDAWEAAQPTEADLKELGITRPPQAQGTPRRRGKRATGGRSTSKRARQA